MEQIKSILREAQSRIKEGGSYVGKAAANMLESTNVIGSGASAVNTENVGYLNQPMSANSRLFDLFPKVFVNSHSIVLADEINPDGTPTSVAEGALKPLLDSDYRASNPQMVKYAVRSVVSDEMLSDIDFMQEAIGNQLMRRLKDKIAEAYILFLANNNGFNASNLTAGTGAAGSKIMDTFPAIYQDLLIKNGHDANLFLTNTPDYAKAWIQDSNAENFLEWSDKLFLPTSAFGSGQIMAVATEAQRMYIYKDLQIELGKNNADFANNTTTIRCEARIAFSSNLNSVSGVYYDTLVNTFAAIA